MPTVDFDEVRQYIDISNSATHRAAAEILAVSEVIDAMTDRGRV